MPERLDVSATGPTTKEESEHLERYEWAASLVRGAVLDVACGTGYGARILARRAAVSGVDRDPQAVGTTASRVEGDFLVSELPIIPFPDETFDFVVSFETIEHVDDDVGFVREIRRVLRPGGSLLISTPNEEVSAPDGVPINAWHAREYTLAGLIATLREGGGFEIRDIAQQTFPAPKTLHWLAWRLYGRAWLRPHVLRFGKRALWGRTSVEPVVGRRRPGYWLVAAD